MVQLSILLVGNGGILQVGGDLVNLAVGLIGLGGLDLGNLLLGGLNVLKDISVSKYSNRALCIFNLHAESGQSGQTSSARA